MTKPDPQTTIPEGWQLVPIKPTLEMLNALHMAKAGLITHPTENAYREMLAAAPTHYSVVRGILKDD